MVIEASRELDAAEALLLEMAALVAESDLLYDDEFDPEYDVDPTDGEQALDYGDSGEDLNNLAAAAYALQAGMPVTRWKMARKNARAREQAKRAARQFHSYAMSQWALYAAGQIDVATMNSRVLASFRRQARNAFIAGRRAMGAMQAISPDDEALLQEILGFDEGNLGSLNGEDSTEHAGIIGTVNQYYNQYTNAQMVKDWSKKAIGAEEDKKITDYAKEVAPKLLAAGTGIGAAEKVDESLTYKEGWSQLNDKLGFYAGEVENTVHAGEMNALGGLPAEAVLVWWQLGDADHCPDCIALSDASPLFLSALDEQGIFPGSGHTRCGGNCYCSLDYEVPDQVCADGMLPDGGDPSLALTEAGVSGRVNVWVQEADSCDNPVDIASMDVGDQPALDEDAAYNWDEDVQSTFEGNLDESLDYAGVLTDDSAVSIDLAKLFGFMNRLIPPELTDELRIGDLHDATSTYNFVWHSAADAIHFHAGLIREGPPALEHEFTLRALSQLSQKAAAEGKALVIDGKAASPGMAKWLDTLGAEHKFIGTEGPKIVPVFPKAYIPPKDLFIPGRVTIGVSRMRPELGTADSIEAVEALRLKPAIHDAEQATSSDLTKLKIATDGQQPVVGRYTFEDVSGGEPSLQVELNPHKVSVQDIDIANAYLVRRNLQDSTITTIVGDDMKRLGLRPNGYLLRVTGLPVKKMDEVYDTVGKLVPVASIDAVHGIVEFSVFEADVTPELKAGFAKIADSFPGAKLAIQDAHVRWYFHDAATRTATDFIHGPAEDLLTADEVKAAYPSDLRTNAIGDARGTVGSVAGGVAGTTAAAVTGYGLGAPEADLARLIAEPVHLATSAADIKVLDHEFEPLAKTWRQSLTAAEHEAITQHQLDSGGFINDYLRKGSPQSLSDLHDALTLVHPTDLTTEALIAATDSAIAKGTIPEALSLGGSKDIVYRGIDKTGVPKIGDVLQDKGYLSTSFDPEKAAQFATQKSMPNVTYPAGTFPIGSKSVVYRYVLPKGHAAGIIDGEFVEGYSKEREVLLPRDEQFRVVRVRRDVEWVNDAGETYSLTVVDVVPEKNITYRKSEDWLKTVRPHFVAPDPSDLMLDPHTKLGGLTQKAIFVEKAPVAPVRQALVDFRQKWVGQAAEHGQIIDGKTGSILVDKAGSAAQDVAKQLQTGASGAEVSFTTDEKALLKGNVLTHTHPVDFAFSTEDIWAGVLHDAGEVRAESPGYSFSIRPGSSGWRAKFPEGVQMGTVREELDKAWAAAENDALDAMNKAHPGASVDELTALAQRDTVRRIAAQYGWLYTETPGGITVPEGSKWLFKPKKVFINDIGLSRDAANVEKTADYIYDAIGVDVKAVEPYTADFPQKTGLVLTGGNIQRLAPDLHPITDLATDADPQSVLDALTKAQTTQLAQHQIGDWLLGNDDGHIGQWMLDAKGNVVGIDKDAAIWEIASQQATGAVTMDDGKSFARAIFDHPTTERLAKLDPAGIAAVLNKADGLTDFDYIERMRPIIATLMAHPNAVKLDETGWIDIILKRKHELRHDVDTYYAAKISDIKRAGIELPEAWKTWDLQGQHFPAATDVKSALHYEAKGPPVDLPVSRGPVGLKPLDVQQYNIPGSPIPLNAPLPAWSGVIPDEPPLPKLKATPEELTQAREDAHAVTRNVDGVIGGQYPVGISFTPEDSVKAEQAGLAYAKLGGVRVYAKTEADLTPLKDYLAVKGHSTFDHEFENLLGYSDEDIAKLDAYDQAKKGYSLRAGAIVVEPDGRMWVLAPNNKFAGYLNTWPKGGVDGTETAAAAAVRELREETGLGIELDGFLGDYVNSDNTAVSRMYVAHRVGGGPLYAAPKETYKIRLMTPAQAEKNLLRYGKPDPRDQAILKDARAAIEGKTGDLQYVVPAADATDFHNAIATVKDVNAVPDGKPTAWPTIDFSPNPVTLRPVSAGNAFVFDPAAVKALVGSETDLPASSTKFPYQRTVWPIGGQKATMYWRPKGFGIEWANSKAQIDDPGLRQTVHMAQVQKFGAMFEAQPSLQSLRISNDLLDQVPHLKEMVAAVGGYTPEVKQSFLNRAQIAKMYAASKGSPIDKVGTVVHVRTAAVDPAKVILGRSKVGIEKVADALGSVAVVPRPPEPPKATLADLGKIADIKARKATFAALPEAERAALADAANTVPASIDNLMKVAGPRPELDPLQSVNLRMKQVQNVDLIAGQQALDARSWTFSLRDQLFQSGVKDEKALRDILLDTYDALVAQENVSMSQVLGDHGIRHALGNAQRAIQTLAVVPGHDTAEDKAMMSLAAALHDIGYLTPTGRMMLTADHPLWSMEAFDARFRPNLEKAFGKPWTDELAHIIETHDTSELDWVNEPRASAFRLADNLALFEADKMPGLIAYVPNNKAVLVDYAEGKLTLAGAQTELRHNIDVAFPGQMTPLSFQLYQAVHGVDANLPKFLVGMIGGKVGDIEWVDGHVAVDLIRGEENEALSMVVDAGQAQFAKFAKSYGLDGKAFVDDGVFTFKNPDGTVALTAKVETPKGVLVSKDTAAITDPDTQAIADQLNAVAITGPPYATLPGETYTWTVPGVTVAPQTTWFGAGTAQAINGEIGHLDEQAQVAIVAATIAKTTLAPDTVNIVVAVHLRGPAVDKWLSETFHVATPDGAAILIPRADIEAWKAGLHADFVEHKIDPSIMNAVEHPEPVSHGPVGGALTTKYGFKPDVLNGFVVDEGTTDAQGHLTQMVTGPGMVVPVHVESSVAGDIFVWHAITGGGVSQAYRRQAALRYLRDVSHAFADDPALEVLLIRKEVVANAGSDFRDLVAEFTDQTGKPPVDFGLPRSTVLAIRDALDKETLGFEAPVPTPEAGIKALIGTPPGITDVSYTTYGFKIARGDWTASVSTFLGDVAVYGGDASHLASIADVASHQLADLVAMANEGTFTVLRMGHLDPELRVALLDRGAVSLDDGAIRMTRAQLQSLAAEYKGTATVGSIGADFVKDVTLLASPGETQATITVLDAAFKDYATNLSPWEKSALAKYQSADVVKDDITGKAFSALDINEYLRDPESPVFVGKTAAAEKFVVVMDAAIGKGAVTEDTVTHLTAKTKEPFIVYRGRPNAPLAKVGDIITDPGYVSTSIDPVKAAEFAGAGGEPALYRITVPAGMNAAWMEAANLSPGGFTEAELLLPRGQTWRVTAVGKISIPSAAGGAKEARLVDLVLDSTPAKIEVAAPVVAKAAEFSVPANVTKLIAFSHTDDVVAKSEELLPSYKDYAKGEIQLRRTTYGKAAADTTYGSVVWRRWGNRIEAWEVADAKFPAQVGFLNHVASSMDAYPKIAYLRIIHPEDLHDGLLQMLKDTGAKEYSGGLRIEREDLAKVRDALKEAIPAATAVEPTVDVLAPLTKYNLLNQGFLSVKDQVLVANDMKMATTVPDKYKFVWATWTAPSGLSAKIVTRTSKTELWWRRVLPGASSSAAVTEKAVLREWVRQGEAFEANPGWARMRITGLKGLPTGFVQMLKDRGAETIDADTLHLGRDKVLQVRDDIRAALGQTALPVLEPLVGAGADQMGDLLGGTGWDSDLFKPITTKNLGITGGWVAAFQATPFSVLYDKVPAGDLLATPGSVIVTGFTHTAVPQAEKGSAFGAFLAQASKNAAVPVRLRQSVADAFPELRDALLDAGAVWDNGELLLDQVTLGHLQDALADGKALPKGVVPVIKATDTKLSAQLGYDHASYMGISTTRSVDAFVVKVPGMYAMTAKYESAAATTADGFDKIGVATIHPALTTLLAPQLAVLAQAARESETGWKAGGFAVRRIVLPKGEWPTKVLDLVQASGGEFTSEGLVIDYEHYSKLAAKIEDDIGSEAPLLGSAASEAPLKVWPDIQGQFDAMAVGGAKPVNSYLGIPIAANTLTSGIVVKTTSFPDVSYEWVQLSSQISITNYHNLQVYGSGFPGPAGMVAMMRHFGSLAAADPAIDEVIINSKNLGSIQTDWLKAWGAKESFEKSAQGDVLNKFLTLDRQQVLDLRDQIEAQFLDTGIPAAAVTSPALGGILHAANTTEEAVAKTGATWADVPGYVSTSGYHKATVGGAQVTWWWSPPSTTLAWSDLNVLGAPDPGASALATMRHLLDKMEALPEATELNFGATLGLSADMEKMLIDHGAIKMPATGVLRLPREKALVLLAELDKTAPAGMGSLDAVEGLGHIPGPAIDEASLKAVAADHMSNYTTVNPKAFPADGTTLAYTSQPNVNGLLYTEVTGPTETARAHTFLAEFYNDYVQGGYSSESVILAPAALAATGLKATLAAYGTDAAEGFAIDTKKLIAAMKDGSFFSGTAAEAVPVIGTHLSVGQKVGIDLDAVKQTKFLGFTGGVKKKVLSFNPSGSDYYSQKAAFTVNVLKDTYRLDAASYGYNMEDVQREAAGYRALQVLASKASADGKAIAVTNNVLAENPKVKTILETYGAKEKTLSSTVGKGLTLDATATASLDSALFREKSGAIYEAKPTGKYITHGEPFSKQSYFHYNKDVADGLRVTTKPLEYPISSLGKGAWMDAASELPHPWSPGSTMTVHLVYKIEHDPLGGVGLTLGTIGYGQGNENLIYRELRDLLNDPDHPIDFVRFRSNTVSQLGSMVQSLGVVQDDVSKEFILNHEQTKLLGQSLKEDKVLWEPDLIASVPEPVVTPPAPPPPVHTPPAPSPVPVAPPPVPEQAASTLGAVYDYPKDVTTALVAKTDTSFNSTIVSVGKHGPSLVDTWTVTSANKVTIKWAYDDHKGTKIAHIRQIAGGTPKAQASAFFAELQHQIAGYMDNPQSYAPLTRVIVDKKALAAMPKIEQMLKDAGWKETKAYYTTDKAGLQKLVADVKADKADWQKASAIPASVAAVPAGAGAAIEDQTATLVLPGKTGKVASPSFIYGYDKAALDKAYGDLTQNDLGVIASVGDKNQTAQTYELNAGSAVGRWSVSPSGKTVGWFDFTGTGDSVADAPAAFAMLRKIAEDAQNRTTDFWVKPEVYDKVVGLRQMLLDAGGSENPYPNIGTAIKMPAKNATALVQSLSGDVMAGLKVSIEHPAEYLGFDHTKALELFESMPTHAIVGNTETTTFDIYKIGQAKSTYVTTNRTVTWQKIEGVPGTSRPLATVAMLEWFNEQGVSQLVVSKDVLIGTPKLAQFLVASGGKVIGDTVSLDAIGLNNAAKFLNKEHLPEMLGGAKLPYAVVDEMATKTTSVVAALHSEQIATDGLTRKSYFSFGSASLETDWTRSQDNIYWRGITTTIGSVGDERAVAVAQMRSFLVDVAQNANLQRLDIDARVIQTVPHMRDVLAKFGATEHTENGATFWSIDRGRAGKLRDALDKELGDLAVGPPGYAMDQAKMIVWPKAEDLTVANPKAAAALGGQTRKAIFTDRQGNQWLFKPGASGRGAVTDQAASELATRLGLPMPSTRVYTLNLALPGEPEQLVQGSLYKMLPNVTPVDIASLAPAQVQDLMRQSVLDWLIANDDAHAANFLINANDGKVWAIDKSRAWVTFHGAHDVLSRASEGNLGGTPVLFKFFRNAVDDPRKLAAIHPTTIGITLRHLQEISDEEFERIVGPVARAVTDNPRYKGNPEKFLADMLDRKHSAASDFEAFFRTQIKDAIKADEGAVPEEWKKWLAAGGEFDLTATPQDLWKERMADLDSKYGTYSATALSQKLSESVFSPIRGEITSYFGGGASGHASGKYGSELIRPRLERKGLLDAMKEWQDLNQWGLLHIVSGDAGPQSNRMDQMIRNFWNPDTGTFRITHSTSRYGSGSNPQAYLDGMNRDGVRNLIGTAIGTHVVVAGGGGVYYYIDLPYDQVFSSMALGYGHGEGESEMLAADVRPEQVIAIRNQNSPMDLTKLMAYQGPVVSKVA